MNVVYLLLGSNLNDRLASIRRARKEIALRVGRVTKESSVYESEPWGFHSDLKFLNQVIRIETELEPLKILDLVLKIEGELGRIRDLNLGYASRPIDIDILFFNHEIISEVNLAIPHPRIAERMFTLIPLAEIEENFIHPVLHKSVGELVNECTDKLAVYPYLF